MNKNNIISPFKPAKHQHQLCLDAVISAARNHCQKEGLRLTPLRQRVLELIWRNHEPVKAYDILDELKTGHAKSAPPTVYRALDFLQEQGMVHKIESLNAYVGCGQPNGIHKTQFLICEKCACVAELDDMDIKLALEKKANALGFKIAKQTVEIVGVCESCQ